MKNFVFTTILFLLTVFSGTSANAALIYTGEPNLTVDSQMVANTHPWIAKQVYAFPYSNWRLYFNDNKPSNPNQPPPYYDYDFNDIVADISFDGHNRGTATSHGVGLSAYNNAIRFYGNGNAGGDLYEAPGPVLDLGTFIIGEAVKYRLWVNNDANMSNSQSFYWKDNGNGSGLNTMVQRLPDTPPPFDPPSDVPEPGTYAMLGTGLLSMSLWRLKKR